MSNPIRIQITSQDLERLERLMASAPKNVSNYELEEQLEHAAVLRPTEIRDDVATINSRVRFRDEDTNEEEEMVIVHPSEADPSRGRVSVLAPVGSALLGHSVGEIVEWPIHSGRFRRLRVVSIVYQPEAAGDFHLW